MNVLHSNSNSAFCRTNYVWGLIFLSTLALFNTAEAANGVTFQTRNEASAACSLVENGWLSRGEFTVTGVTTHIACVVNSCSLNSSTKTYSLQIGAYASDLITCQTSYVYRVQDYINSQSWDTTTQSNGGATFRYTQENPTCVAGVVINNIKAPTANGSGLACHNYCFVQVALQAPPSPLFSAMQTGESCDVNNTLPAEDPSSDPCAGQDPLLCVGTGDPGSQVPPGGAAGGIQCDSPPLCNSDGVNCAILYQNWANRCESQANSVKNAETLDSINDGIGGVKSELEGIGSGLGDITDKLDDLIDGQETTNEHLEDISSDSTQSKNFLEQIKDAISDIRSKLLGSSDPWGGATSEESFGISEEDIDKLKKTVNLDMNDLDDSGFGLSRECPVWEDISFTIGISAVIIPLSGFTAHCEIFEWTGYLIVAFSFYFAAQILLSSRR